MRNVFKTRPGSRQHRLGLAILLVAVCTAMPACLEAAAREQGTPPSDEAGPDTDVATRHALRIDGQTIRYTAHVGSLAVRRDDGTPYARLFFVAYVRDHMPAKSRPITFLYNGGPGVATLWVNIGGWGPVRVSRAQADSGRIGSEPNPYSLLDKSDLVFIDAPETGYSRLVGDAKLQDIAGIDQDIETYARFISVYLDRSDRWQSPKYIYGESYGTPRSAGLAAALHSRGIDLKGVILQSTVLNYNRRASGMDINYAITLPSFAAIAWHFGKAPAGVSQTDFISQARAFADGPYLTALFAGDTLPSDQARAIAAKLGYLTGLDTRYVLDSNLRISVPRFRKQLLRDRRLVLGRYDARDTGPDDDAVGEQPSWDPSDEAVTDSYASAYKAYLQDQLGFRPTSEYRLLNLPLNRAWSESHKPFMSGSSNGGEMPLGDLTVDLGAVMRAEPHLWIFSSNGLYDLGTPFGGAEHDLGHLGLGSAALRRIRFGYYQAGHMIYADDDAIKAAKRDLARFYDDSCNCDGR